jgi:hypothetical protein
MVLLFLGTTVYRALRSPAARRAAAGRTVRAIALGLALGIGLGSGPTLLRQPIADGVTSVFHEEAAAMPVHGTALDQAVVDELSKTPTGRDVLDGLRDRFGVVHMPPFYVGQTKNADIAEYVIMEGVIIINAAEISGRGWTPERFTSDPAAQRALAPMMANTLAHELRHAGQALRSPLQDGQFTHVQNFEGEEEAYLTELFLVHDKLKADPHAQIASDELGNYLSGLPGLDAFRRGIDSSYPHDVHVDTAYYRAYFARMQAEWPRWQVEANILLARRASHMPPVAAKHLDTARAIAAQHGLSFEAIESSLPKS